MLLSLLKKQVITDCYLYKKNTCYFRFQFLLKCNLHSIFFTEGACARTWGDLQGLRVAHVGTAPIMYTVCRSNVSSKEEIYNKIIHILNCMSIVFLIIYFIVYILDHVDHEDLPRDGFWCTVYHLTTTYRFLIFL